MSLFRAAVKVTTPAGRDWEIYAYKARLGERGDPQPLVPEPASLQLGPEWQLLDGIFYLLWLIPRSLWRLAEYAAALVRSVFSDAWTIEAVSYMPQETAYSWTTTSEYKGQVLAQVEGHLARGDLPQQLSNAVYRGESRSAR